MAGGEGCAPVARGKSLAAVRAGGGGGAGCLAAEVGGRGAVGKMTAGGCKSVGGPDVGSIFLFSNWPAAAGEWAAKVCTPDIAAAAAVDTAAGGGRGRGTVLKADFNFCLGMSWIFGCRLAAVMCVSTAVDVVGVDTTGLI